MLDIEHSYLFSFFRLKLNAIFYPWMSIVRKKL